LHCIDKANLRALCTHRQPRRKHFGAHAMVARAQVCSGAVGPLPSLRRSTSASAAMRAVVASIASCATKPKGMSTYRQRCAEPAGAIACSVLGQLLSHSAALCACRVPSQPGAAHRPCRTDRPTQASPRRPGRSSRRRPSSARRCPTAAVP
jgi:hypothetical protein